jgi:hypothetical protein
MRLRGVDYDSYQQYHLPGRNLSRAVMKEEGARGSGVRNGGERGGAIWHSQ